MCTRLCLSLSFFVYIYIYICLYQHVHMYVCLYLGLISIASHDLSKVEKARSQFGKQSSNICRVSSALGLFCERHVYKAGPMNPMGPTAATIPPGPSVEQLLLEGPLAPLPSRKS